MNIVIKVFYTLKEERLMRDFSIINGYGDDFVETLDMLPEFISDCYNDISITDIGIKFNDLYVKPTTKVTAQEFIDRQRINLGIDEFILFTDQFLENKVTIDDTECPYMSEEEEKEYTKTEKAIEVKYINTLLKQYKNRRTNVNKLYRKAVMSLDKAKITIEESNKIIIDDGYIVRLAYEQLGYTFTFSTAKLTKDELISKTEHVSRQMFDTHTGRIIRIKINENEQSFDSYDELKEFLITQIK